jgi:hypothetical protein
VDLLEPSVSGDHRRIEADLAEAGATMTESLPYTLDPGTIQAQASQIIAKLKSSGVTTVVLVSDGIAPRDLTREATAQEYFPEWVIVSPALSGPHGVRPDLRPDTVGQCLRRHPRCRSGHTGDLRVLRPLPVVHGSRAPGQGHDRTPDAELHVPGRDPAGDGSDLTPQRFRDALFAGAGTTPALTQPLLTYGDKDFWPDTDYNGVDDATLIWWDATATGPDEIRKQGTGMWTFVDGGKRYLPGEWPTDVKLFDPEGAVTMYDIPPPEETPPDYPSPAG